MLAHKEGYYIIYFKNKAEHEAVLNGGMYYVDKRPIVVMNWIVDFDFNKEVARSIPIWVQLHGLSVA